MPIQGFTCYTGCQDRAGYGNSIKMLIIDGRMKHVDSKIRVYLTGSRVYTDGMHTGGLHVDGDAGGLCVDGDAGGLYVDGDASGLHVDGDANRSQCTTVYQMTCNTVHKKWPYGHFVALLWGHRCLVCHFQHAASNTNLRKNAYTISIVPEILAVNMLGRRSHKQIPNVWQCIEISRCFVP